MKFELNEKQVQDVQEFKRVAEKNRSYLISKGVFEESCLTFLYVFEHSSIGTAATIECPELGMGADITDWASW